MIESEEAAAVLVEMNKKYKAIIEKQHKDLKAIYKKSLRINTITNIVFFAAMALCFFSFGFSTGGHVMRNQMLKEKAHWLMEARPDTGPDLTQPHK